MLGIAFLVFLLLFGLSCFTFYIAIRAVVVSVWLSFGFGVIAFLLASYAYNLIYHLITIQGYTSQLIINNKLLEKNKEEVKNVIADITENQ